MTFSLRPAVRQDTPLIIGLAGPSKSGKTYSAHRLAQGLARGRPIAMLNAEGARGHQYAERFKYLACDIEPPFSYERYTEAVLEIARSGPGVLIVDSVSHAHDGPGGMLEEHDTELARLAGDRTGRDRDRFNFTAWIKPKAAENKIIYTMLGLACPVILCFRAKEKLKIVPGKAPEDLGWQPISSDRIAFETIFTLMLPPHSKGVPDLALSDMREPFDTLVPGNAAIDEDLGEQLADWAAGAAKPQPSYITEEQVATLETMCTDAKIPFDLLKRAAQVDSLTKILAADFAPALEWIKKKSARAGATSGQ